MSDVIESQTVVQPSPCRTPPMRIALAVTLALLAASPAGAAGLIRCTAKGQEPVTISLDSQRFKGRSLSCVSGSFVVDMTPCAPAGAYALSAPTGSASIVDVVPRWQDFTDHTGGIVGLVQNSQEITFTGGFHSSQSGFSDDWTFKVDRVSGAAKLTQQGKAEISFACDKVKPKF